ncbi:MAG: Hsp20/alpha crystallin family protein [Anaerolineales bacterium]|nr:Hsp20/alpha crystallin family protein [Anaerolineales bacterium]
MTAHRPRQSRPSDDPSLVEVLFTGAYSTGTGWLASRRSHAWRPPTDIYETETAIVVQVELAGMRRENISIELQDRRLMIAGIRPHDRSVPRSYHQIEINFGEFRVDVELPTAVATAEIQAEYEDGFLRITLPKLQPRRLEIR